jgi:thiol-disulfide isomerase/thioredoxin
MAIFFNINLFSQNITIPPFVDLLEYTNEHGRSSSHFRLWGWSKNGKVAYSIDKSIEGRGGTITSAIIFNFIDDDIIWEQSIDSVEWENSTDLDKNIAYDKFCQEYQNICIRNNIEFVQIEYNNFPIRHNNQILNLIIEDIAKKKNLQRWGDEISSYKVIVETQGKKKVIQSKNHVRAFYVFPCGYFISPYENRALIVIGEMVPVSEGGDIDFYFIGCHLSYGFN